MLINDDKQTLLKQFAFLRFFLMFAISLVDINYKVKIGLYLLLDIIDCPNYMMNISCNNSTYQILDKINDMISYVCIIFAVRKHMKISEYVYFALIYRLIGVFLHTFNNKRSTLVFYPDLFKELLLYNYYCDKMKIREDKKIIILILVLKIAFEKYWHFDKNNKQFNILLNIKLFINILII
jgi:hypothetical protein